MEKNLFCFFKVLCIICAFFWDTSIAFSSENPFTCDLFIVFFIFLVFFYAYQTINGKISFKKKILCIFFSVCTLLGQSYMKVGSWNLICGSFLDTFFSTYFFLGYYFLFEKGFILFDQYLFKKEKNFKITSRVLQKFEDHPFIFSFFFLCLSYSIYIIAFYPGILSNDPSYQILQYFNIPNKYDHYVVLLDSSVHLTNHHPVLHTLLLGGCIEIGKFLENDNFGLFIYTLLQTLVLISTLSYSIFFCKKVNISSRKRFLLLCIYAFVPMFPFYAVSSVKDTLYTCFVFVYIIFLCDFVIIGKKKKYKRKEIFSLICLLCLIFLFRNNGFYIILFSFPFLFYQKKTRKQLITIFCLFLCMYTLYNQVLLPYFKITNGSIREMLSIPFQQTARYVKTHNEEITKEEIKIINKILPYKELIKKYNPEISDPIKNQFNRYASKNDVKKYFRVWLEEFRKHPTTYIQATLHNTYGYFYPGKLNWYLYGKYNNTVVKEGIMNYHYNSLNYLRSLLMKYGDIFPYIPIFGLLSNIGFSTWILFVMMMYYIERKKEKMIIPLLPSFLSLLVCVASPVNCYFRYAMPYVFTLPFLLLIFLKVIRQS